MSTSTSDYFCYFTVDTDISLHCVEDAHTRESTRHILKREDLYPGNGKGFMKEEKKGWLKGDTIIFDTDSNTSIIISEFFEAHR